MGKEEGERMSGRVMIIDNTRDALGEYHCDIVARELSMNYCQTMSFMGGEPALESFADFQPQLVICDAHLADGVTAWDIAFSILAQGYTVKPCYLVALLTKPTRKSRVLCEEFGYDEIIGKTVNTFTLLGWVTKAKARAEQVV